MGPERALVALGAALLAGCGGGGGAGPVPAPAPTPRLLEASDVQRIVVQALAEAQARGVRAHVAVVDRAGNVLATFEMTGAPETVAIASGRGIAGGLDGIAAGAVPAALSAIAKALTGAYLSSGGNAFSTRTAGQIVQEHFNPQEVQQPAGPLYGVQFSQLPCSDVMGSAPEGRTGPQRSPLGLSADPGGLPLYRDGTVVGGIGIEADGLYGLDRDIVDVDDAVEERIAAAGAAGFAAPPDIRGERITADGRTFRYLDVSMPAPGGAPPGDLAAFPGRLVAVPGFSEAVLRPGTAFGTAASGILAVGPELAGSEAEILVDGAGANRYPARSAADGRLREDEVRILLSEALATARRTRAQIRRPPGSSARVNVTVVDASGEILGFVRAPDAPVFGIDVSVQKARTAAFFSHPLAARLLEPLPAATHLAGEAPPTAFDYVARTRAFLGEPREFTGITAWSTRALGNLHRPFFPDGVAPSPHGPLSTPLARWSPFNVGLQLDLVYDVLVASLGGRTSGSCVGLAGSHLRNGMQIFPGGVPLYRGGELVGAIGVSGDGVDQDDMVAYRAVTALESRGTGLGHASAGMRADRYAPHGARLRYVQCPQAPFLDALTQDACE